MAYRLRKKDHSVERAVRRIAREQVDRAVASTERGDDLAAAVHDVRKRCKKLRGLIRLVRPSFERFADENADLREIGRLLGALRESAVLQDTYDSLGAHGAWADAARRQFSQGLEAHRRDRSADPAAGLADARERLLLVHARIGGWTLAADGWPAIGPGLMRTYMRARAALDRIGASHAPGRYHELRKSTKYHWHHMRLLRPLHPKMIEARIELAAELGDRLGEHHDLAVLEATLHRDAANFGEERDVDEVRLLARHQRLPIEEECLRMARQLFAESAESFTESLGAQWASWRD